MLRSSRALTVAAAFFLAAAVPAIPCGPDFPNAVLSSGDAALLSAPAADFERELARILASTPGARPAPKAGEGPGAPGFTDARNDRTTEQEVADIEDAMRARGDAPAVIEETLAAVRALRRRLDALAARRDPADALPRGGDVPSEVPEPFRTYLVGALRWRRGEMPEARAAWRRIRAMPAEQQRLRAVWAEYMLARSLVGSDGVRALGGTRAEAAEALVAGMRSVRDLAAAGWPDPLGLAEQSWGWEARGELDRGDAAAALRLYALHGDFASILRACDRVLALSHDAMAGAVADPLVRRIVTAYCVSHGGPRRGEIAPSFAVMRRWLAAVERTPLRDVTDADRLAWLAYMAGEYELAARWLARADMAQPVALWIGSRLDLRAGRIAEAATKVAAAAQGFPRDEVWPGGSLWTSDADPGPLDRIADDQGMQPRAVLCGESAVFALRRGDFAESLSLLCDAGLHEDAAYVAERVLTTGELVHWITANVPQHADAMRAGDAPGVGGAPVSGDTLRHLLGRRLAREGRVAEARPWFPSAHRASFDALAAALAEGRDAAAAPDVRAARLQAAARVLILHGADLVDCEGGPDWAMYAGEGTAPTWRDGARDPSTNRSAFNLATPAEWSRVAESRPPLAGAPYHRRLAAVLAWEAAELLAEETDGAAAWYVEVIAWFTTPGRPLTRGSTAVGDTDDDTRDAARFRDALIRRCGTTSPGEAAKSSVEPRVEADSDPAVR